MKQMLKHRISVKRPAYDKDGSGGQELTGYTYTYRNVPASVQPASVSEKLLFAREDLILTDKMYVATDLSLQAEDIIEYNGNDYKNQGVMNAVNAGRVWEIALSKVE